MNFRENGNPTRNQCVCQLEKSGAASVRGSYTVFSSEVTLPGNSLDTHLPAAGGLPELGYGSTSILHEVAAFLDMWSSIEEGFAALAILDQKAFRHDHDVIPPVFQGFDGIREGDYKRAARFMIENLERFGEFAGRDLESYHPVVHQYRQILDTFRPLWDQIDGGRHLTANELRVILTCSSTHEWST